MKFELCTDSVEGAKMASKFNFSSIELCAALSVGGLTPSFGMIKKCAENCSAEVHVMIRHNEGDFICTEKDVELMRSDIQAASKAGAQGVVLGILNEASQVSDQNLELLEKANAEGLKTTFHRAFDFCPDPREAIERIIDMGFDRLLTSGLKPKAIQGINLLSQLQVDYGNQIQLIAGSGLNSENAIHFKNAGIKSIHFTARKPKTEEVQLGMGRYYLTDEDKIEAILGSLA